MWGVYRDRFVEDRYLILKHGAEFSADLTGADWQFVGRQPFVHWPIVQEVVRLGYAIARDRREAGQKEVGYEMAISARGR